MSAQSYKAPYKTVMCANLFAMDGTPTGGTCPFGPKCHYAHSVAERREDRNAPLCDFYSRGKCTNGSFCPFRHDTDTRTARPTGPPRDRAADNKFVVDQRGPLGDLARGRGNYAKTSLVLGF